MSSFSNYLEAKVLEHIVGKTAYAKPTVYVALYTSTPGEGSSGTECTGTGYSRLATDADDWNNASHAALAEITNAVDFEWGPAVSTWGTIVGVALLDAPSGGNVLLYGTTQSPKLIESGDTYRIASGQLRITLD